MQALGIYIVGKRQRQSKCSHLIIIKYWQIKMMIKLYESFFKYLNQMNLEKLDFIFTSIKR